MSTTATTKTNALAGLGKRRNGDDAENDDPSYAPTASAAKKPRKAVAGPKVGKCGMTKKDLGDAIKYVALCAQVRAT